MVRQSKQTPDQKKDTHKKKTPQQDKLSPKKPADSTVWPCRINGCNKQFAREADLKRHQRTTKLHSVPGFACPQCDARFTRTDALRRHQKSRHNGVVIEPTDGTDRGRSAGDEDPHSSGSRSKSRSRTPSSKENPVVPPPPVPPGGPQSYYRQHTFAGVMIPPPGVMVDGHYPPVLPTSATRLHQASWQQPWGADGSQPHMIHPGYAHPYYYYRPGTVMHPAPEGVAHEQIPNGVSSSSGGSSSSRQGSPLLAVDPSLDHGGMEELSETGEAEATVIDPSLVSPHSRSADNGESSVDNQTTRIPETATSNRMQHIASPASGDPPNEEANDTDSEAAIVRNLLSPGHGHPYSPPHPSHLEHPLGMEQMLTEDGEPMLNPAELLTQESLASPPPS